MKKPRAVTRLVRPYLGMATKCQLKCTSAVAKASAPSVYATVTTRSPDAVATNDIARTLTW